MQRDPSYGNPTVVTNSSFKVKLHLLKRYGFLQKYAGSGEIWFTSNLEILNIMMKLGKLIL